MKRLIMLFLLVSFTCFGEEKIEPKKSYEVIQREEIDFLKTQLMKSNNKIDDLNKKIEELEEKGENNLGLTYNVDQIYQNSVQYYDKTISHVKWIASIAGAIISLLLTALLGSTWYIKNNNDKKLKEEKEEVTKELDKRVERMWKENTELKEKIAEQENHIEKKVTVLNKRIEIENNKIDRKIKTVEFYTDLVMVMNRKSIPEKREGLFKLSEDCPNGCESKVYFELATIMIEGFGIDSEVISLYTKAIKSDPDNGYLYYKRGSAEEVMGDRIINNKNAKICYESAIKNYVKAIELEPENRMYKNKKEKVDEKLKELEGK